MVPPVAETKTRLPADATLLTLAGIALVAVVVRIALMVTTGSTAEDFYITLRYAENLGSGHGFVYNVGERVLGTTTPLYAMFLALTHALGLPAPLFGKLANILVDGFSCYLIWRLGRNARKPGAGLVAAALFALSPPNLTWAISGMETSLVTACTLGLMVAVTERRLAFVAVLSAALYMLRIDGLLAVAVAYGALLWSSRRHGDRQALANSAVLFLTLCAPWTLFAWVYFGSPLPTSALAKLTVYAWLSKGVLPNLQPFVQQMTHSALHLLVLTGAAMGIVVGLRRMPVLRPVMLWMVVYYAAMAFSKGFLFGWYYVPPTGVYFLLAMIGWGTLIVGLNRPLGRFGGKAFDRNPGIAGVGAALLVLLVALVRIPGVQAQLEADQETEERFRKTIGLDLRRIIPPGERLMLEPIGYIGYFSRARILDAVGLVSREAIPFYRKGAISPYLDMMHDLKPEWVLLRAGEYEDASGAEVTHDRAITTHYQFNRTFSDPEDPPGSMPGFYLFRRDEHVPHP